MNELITRGSSDEVESQQRFEFGLSLAYVLVRVSKVLSVFSSECRNSTGSRDTTVRALPFKGGGAKPSPSAEQAYLAHVASFKRLSAGEERATAARMRSGDEAARNQLVSANLGLVVMFAKRYSRSSGAAFLDLAAEGNIALLQATRTFDPTLGFRFSTYAKRPVTQAMVRALPRLSGAITVPISKQEPQQHESCAAKQLPVRGTAQSLKNTFTVLPKGPSAAIDLGPLPDTADLPADEKHGPANQVNHILRDKTLSGALLSLATRERDIMISRFGLAGSEPATLAILALRYDISIERVRQIENAGLKRLADYFVNSGHDLETLLQVWER